MASTWSSSRTASKSSSRGGWPIRRSAAAANRAPSMHWAVRSRSTRRGDRQVGPRASLLSQAVEEALDFFGGGEMAEDGALSRGEGVGHRVKVSTVERASWPAMPAFPQDPDLTGTTSLPYTSPYADSAPCLVVRRRPQPV